MNLYYLTGKHVVSGEPLRLVAVAKNPDQACKMVIEDVEEFADVPQVVVIGVASQAITEPDLFRADILTPQAKGTLFSISVDDEQPATEKYGCVAASNDLQALSKFYKAAKVGEFNSRRIKRLGELSAPFPPKGKPERKKPKHFLTFRADHPLHITRKDREWKGALRDIQVKGYAGTEIGDLSFAAACFLLPRLKELRRCTVGYPPDLTYEEWLKALDKMVAAMEHIVNDDINDEKASTEAHEGCELLGKHFLALWD